MKYLAILSACLFLSACSAGDPAPDATKIYPAKAVVTVDPSNPYAEAVAVAGEDIVGVGSLEALQTQFPRAEFDTQYQNAIIIPGLIDPHVHMTLGSMTVSYTHLTLPTIYSV